MSSIAEARSESQCQDEAWRATGQIQGLEYTQAVTACMLDNTLELRTGNPNIPEVVVVKKKAPPEIAFSASRQVSSGMWVRVSPYRWVLKPHQTHRRTSSECRTIIKCSKKQLHP